MKKIIVSMFVWMLLIGNVGILGFIQTASAQEPLTISGQIRHNNEAGVLDDSRYIKVEAFEKQAIPFTDYKIAEGYTDDAGHFSFTHDIDGNPILNEDTAFGESGTRDIYIRYFAENEAARVSENWVAGALGNTYSGETAVDYDVTGPTWNIVQLVTSDNSPALGIPALIKADRDWLSSITGGWNRDQLSVLYPDTDWPNFFSIWVYNVMRIPDGYADRTEILSHEYGHSVHYSARDGNLPLASNPVGEEDPNNWPVLGSGDHWIFSESSDGFAIREGWAQFFRNARHGDHQSLETNDYWMGADGNDLFGPNTDGNTGEIVEGAFASILWDLYDGANDDGVDGGFSNIWTVIEIDDPDRVWSSSANDDFYHYWISRFGQTRAVDEIFIDHGIPVIDDSHDLGDGNDDSANASNLGIVDISKTVEDLIVVDIDWYRFTTSIEGNADSEVVIEFDDNRGDLDLFVYRWDDTLVGTGTQFDGGKRISLNGENSGTFKIKVVGTGDDSGTSIYEGDFSPNYDLRITLRGRSGGPDSFGYTFIDSNKHGGPTYDWIEISGTGTEILSSSDDSWVTNINLGFFFNYYGIDYSQLAIGNNGLLFSGVGTSQYVNDPITQSPRIHGFIAPFWDDIVTWGSAGAVYYQTLGTAPNRKFVVEWYDNQHYYSSSSGITFEAILYEGTNNILFQYKDVDFGSVSGAVGGDNPPYNNGGSATVGIEGPTGNIGLQYSFNEQVITPALAIVFKFPAFAGTNMYLSMNAPASMDHGSTMAYTLYYNDFGDVAASNVVLQATLSSNVDFMSASDGGTYDSATRRVTWNIGMVPAFPSGRGSRTVTVRIPSSVPVGTVIQTTASISTSTLETRYDDNSATAQTTVTGSNLPPNVSVGPTLGNLGGTPSVYWRTPITFTYYNPTAIGVDIKIHIDDGGPDITGSMIGGPPTWTYTTTFYPRHGRATVTYTVNDPTPYFPDFDVRNMRGFENTINATEIERYIGAGGADRNYLNSPMLTEAGIGQRFKDAGLTYNVNPAFLVATAEHEGNFGTGGWVVTHNGSHNTMGWSVSPGHMDEDWEGLDRNMFDSWGDCIEHVAWRIRDSGLYYPQNTTVDEIRRVYAELPATATIVRYMNALAESAGQAGEFDENFNLYIDPAGYIYDVDTLERIAGASVWLQRPDSQGGWENVPTGQTPPIMQPDVNPLITGADGQYQWDVLEGSYRVHVEAPGYYPADSIVVNIPPPVTDLHVGLTPLPDGIPPTTTLTIGNPKYIDLSGNVYVTSDTPLTLSAEDNVGGSGVASTGYRISPPSDTGWLDYTIPFYLADLPDGAYNIDYNSTDNVGNVESTHTTPVILDNTSPSIIVSNPPVGRALQDGVTFLGSVVDSGCGVFSMSFSIREANDGEGIQIGFEDLPASYDPITGEWSFSFNTLLVPDGYYVLYIEAGDNLENEASTTVPYSIRNWAVIELLPSSENNKAGRTMPVKFALRVAAEVDPDQPFVYNEELRIEIFATEDPDNVLQESYYGDTARDYRISSMLYITNFKTIKRTPMKYTVAIYRDAFDVGSFTFETVK